MKFRQAILAFVFLLQATNARSDDAAVFMRSCGDCHPSAKALARKIKGETDVERTAALADLLTHHHAPDPASANSIRQYLLGIPVN